MLESLIGYGIGSIIAGIFSVLFTVAAIVGGIILYCTVFSKANDGKYTGFMAKLYDFVNFKKFSIEPLLKVTYIILTVYVTLDAFLSFRGGVWSGLSNLLLKVVVYNAVIRIAYELAMLLVKGLKRLNEINAKLDGEAKGVNSEFEDVLFDEGNRKPKPAAPVQQVQPAAPAPQPVAAVPQPVAPAPQPVSAVSQPVSAVPQPVAPVPQPVSAIPQPVAEPVPQPVAAPAPAESAAAAPTEAALAPSVCKGCGKEIKAGARFCPFCGSAQQ